MTQIHNDSELKAALLALDTAQQRQLAALFIEDVLPFTDDERISRAVAVLLRPVASEDELKRVYSEARTAALDAHARCGEDSEWSGQSPYFVARATEAATGRRNLNQGANIAWAVAMQCRMASCCLASENEPESEDNTCSAQRRIAAEFIASLKGQQHD